VVQHQLPVDEQPRLAGAAHAERGACLLQEGRLRHNPHVGALDLLLENMQGAFQRTFCEDISGYSGTSFWQLCWYWEALGGAHDRLRLDKQPEGKHKADMLSRGGRLHDQREDQEGCTAKAHVDGGGVEAAGGARAVAAAARRRLVRILLRRRVPPETSRGGCRGSGHSEPLAEARRACAPRSSGLHKVPSQARVSTALRHVAGRVLAHRSRSVAAGPQVSIMPLSLSHQPYEHIRAIWLSMLLGGVGQPQGLG